MGIRQKNDVTATPAADPQAALAHFEQRFRFETDCWDVHAAQQNPDWGFVLLDVRSRELYDAGHVPGATHLRHHDITRERMGDYPLDTLFVVRVGAADLLLFFRQEVPHEPVRHFLSEKQQQVCGTYSRHRLATSQARARAPGR